MPINVYGNSEAIGCIRIQWHAIELIIELLSLTFYWESVVSVLNDDINNATIQYWHLLNSIVHFSNIRWSGTFSIFRRPRNGEANSFINIVRFWIHLNTLDRFNESLLEIVECNNFFFVWVYIVVRFSRTNRWHFIWFWRTNFHQKNHWKF